MDSHNTGDTILCGTTCTDGGNNLGWDFVHSSGSTPPPTPTPPKVSVSTGGSSVSSSDLSKYLAPSASTTAYINSLSTSTLPTAPSPAGAYQFKRALRYGMTGSDVKALQEFLNQHGFSLGSTGPGSVGHETTLYSDKTKDAVARFQQAHFKDIITAANLQAPTGMFAQYTRAYANKVSASESWWPK